MRKLAAALDVNPMTIYLRFENKDALLDAVARRVWPSSRPRRRAALERQVRALAIGRNHLIHDRETLRLSAMPTDSAPDS